MDGPTEVLEGGRPLLLPPPLPRPTGVRTLSCHAQTNRAVYGHERLFAVSANRTCRPTYSRNRSDQIQYMHRPIQKNRSNMSFHDIRIY